MQMVSQRSDVVLACFLVAVIFIMILPIPTFLVDTLIVFNITIAIILLMIGIYIESPLSFSAFPSVLLIATMFRLALSVTTTRLILLDANAGDIITTFGNFVVGGNVIVGVVVFSIITVVQFIVVTKGSERIAEVAARFSLDAMPGKQMSIDGDMRSGVIDAQEARRRRSTLEQESKLYGSLDGAMKFVKGDAIAGIFIILINIIGGITVGTLQQGMELGAAAELYTVLTVGDGLVAQIPALFIAVTSGIIVTRVNSEEAGNLGDDIGKQILRQPNALLIGAAALLLFSIIPGFPTFIFLIFSALLATGGMIMRMSNKKLGQAGGVFLKAMEESKKSGSDTPVSLNELDASAPLAIDLAPPLNSEIRFHEFNNEFAKLRHTLYMELGVPFPPALIRYKDYLEKDKYNICLQEIPVAYGEIRSSKLLVLKPEERLTGLGITFEEGDRFNGEKAAWLTEDNLNALEKANVPYLDSNGVLAFHVSAVLRTHASEFIGTQETSQLLSQLKTSRMDLLRELQTIVPLQIIGAVLKLIVAEGIPIRNLSGICEALLSKGADEKDPKALVEFARLELRRQISHKYADSNNEIRVLLLDQTIDETIRGAIQQSQSGAKSLFLDPGTNQKIIDNIKQAVNNLEDGGRGVVLLVSQDTRRFVRDLIEPHLPYFPVLSFKEIMPDISIKPISRLSLY